MECEHCASIEVDGSEVKAEQAGNYAWYNPAYSIGELIEMLPKSLENPYNPPLAIEYNEKWRVYYGVQEDYTWEWSIWYEEKKNELIDAIFAMVVKLKEKGVI